MRPAHTVLRSLLLVAILLAVSLPAAHAARIGLFLGTFDPPHLGVARMIEEARNRLNLEAIYVLPTPSPVDRAEVTPVKHRLAMIRLMAGSVTGMETLTEADMTAIVSRSPDNMFAALREDILCRRSLDDEIFQIVGEDAMPKLIARKQLPHAGERRTLVVFPRQGVPETKHSDLVALEAAGRLVRLRVPIPDLASRDIRALAKAGNVPTTAQLPEILRKYICREGLYGLPPAPLTREILAGLAPTGYWAKPVLLHSPTTDAVFVPAHLESVVATLSGPPANEAPGSDLPAALAALLENHVMQVVLLQAPTTDGLDWLETQGWRTLHGFVPPNGEDWPMLFIGRRGAGWHLFITGIYAHERFARLAADIRDLFRRAEIPTERITILVPPRP